MEKKKHSILGTFARYVSLNILSMVGLSCYILADTAFIANGVGADGLAALNLVLPVYFVVSGLGQMLGMGGATQYAIFRGEDEAERANRVFSQTFLITLLLGILATVIGTVFAEGFAQILGADEKIFDLAVTYLRTLMSFSWAFMLNAMLTCFVRNDEKPNLSMAAMIIGSLSNILFDYLLIFPAGLGMFGAALATGVSPLVSMAVLSIHRIKKTNHFHWIRCRFDGTMLKYTVSIGLPSFINEMASGITLLFFNFILLSLAGNLGVAAYGVVSNLAFVAIAIYTGIAQGIQPIISRSYGAGQKDDIRKVYRYSVILSVTVGVLIYVMCFSMAEPITGLFNKDHDPALLMMASHGLRVYFIAFIYMGINIVTVSYFASVARAVPSFILSVLRGMVAVIVFVLILPGFFGLNGVWISVPCAEAVTLLVSWVMMAILPNGWKDLVFNK